MNPKYILVVCFLFIFATACAPAAPPAADTQSAGAAESAHEAEEGEHSDEEGEHSDEEGEHSDEEGEHGHEDEGERRELGAHEHGAAELMVAWSGSDIAIDLQTPSYNVLGFEYTPESDEEKALLAESIAALEAGGLLQISADAGCTVVSVTVQTAFEEGHDEEGHGEEGHGEEGHDEEGHDEEGHDEEGHDEDAEGHGEDEGEGHDEDAEGHHEEGEDSDEEGHDEEGHDEEGHDEDKEGHDEEGHGEEGHDDHDEEVHSDIAVSYNLECEQPENIASLDASALFAEFPNFEDIDVQWVSDTQASAAELTPDNPVVELQ